MFISLLLHVTWTAVTSTLIWTTPNWLCWGRLPYYWVYIFNRPLNGLQNIMRIWTITQFFWTQRSLKSGFENLKTILLQHGKYNPSWSKYSLSLHSPPSHPPTVAFPATVKIHSTVEKQFWSCKYSPGCSLYILALTETWLPHHSTSLVVLPVSQIEAVYLSLSMNFRARLGLSIFLFPNHNSLSFTSIKCKPPLRFTLCFMVAITNNLPSCLSTFYELSGIQPGVVKPFVLGRLSNFTPQPHRTWALPVFQLLPAKVTP